MVVLCLTSLIRAHVCRVVMHHPLKLSPDILFVLIASLCRTDVSIHFFLLLNLNVIVPSAQIYASTIMVSFSELKS